MIRERYGDWQQTFTGKQFWPLDPRVEEVCLEDIAHALALQCRFAGHCREPYSVAEHSVRVMRAVSTAHCRTDDQRRKVQLAALLHDAPEAYLVDVPRPVKRSPTLYGYREAEDRLAAVIELWARLNRGAFGWTPVKRADAVLLITEARDLLAPPPAPWGVAQGVRLEPLAERIEPWGWRAAEAAFLDAFDHLTNASIPRDPAGLHYHHCPECYEKAPCVMLCTVEGDLSGDGVDFGHHAVCEECQREGVSHG